MKSILPRVLFTASFSATCALAAPIVSMSPSCEKMSKPASVEFDGPSNFAGIPVRFRANIAFLDGGGLVFENGFNNPSWQKRTYDLKHLNYTKISSFQGSAVETNLCEWGGECIGFASESFHDLKELETKLPANYPNRDQTLATIVCAEERLAVYADKLRRLRSRENFGVAPVVARPLAPEEQEEESATHEHGAKKN